MAGARDYVKAAMRDVMEQNLLDRAEARRQGLPHVGLGGPTRSMYGERSTIGEAERVRASLQAQVRRMYAEHATLPLGPIKVTATAGRAIACQVEGCRIHGSE